MKNTLGRGLESLIPKKSAKDLKTSEIKKEPIFYIEIEKIKSNPYQPRRNFDQEGLKALAESIKEHGVLQPILVSRTGEGGLVEYQLVAGERRLLAAKMAGFSQVPVIIRESSEKEKLEVSLIENVQRLDLNPLEKAEAYKRLQEEFNFLQKDIAKLVGKSRVAVTNTLRILDLSAEIKQALREERISEGHARALLTVKEEKKQKILFAKILKDNLSVRETEKLAQKMNIWQPLKKKNLSSLFPEIKNLEEKIREILEIKNFKLGWEAGRPKLTIFFNSKKEINNFLEKIKND